MTIDAIGSSRSAPNNAAPIPAMMTAIDPSASANKCQSAPRMLRLPCACRRNDEGAAEVHEQARGTRR